MEKYGVFRRFFNVLESAGVFFFSQPGDFPLDRNAALVSVGGEISVFSSVPFFLSFLHTYCQHLLVKRIDMLKTDCSRFEEGSKKRHHGKYR